MMPSQSQHQISRMREQIARDNQIRCRRVIDKTRPIPRENLTEETGSDEEYALVVKAAVDGSKTAMAAAAAAQMAAKAAAEAAAASDVMATSEDDETCDSGTIGASCDEMKERQIKVVYSYQGQPKKCVKYTIPLNMLPESQRQGQTKINPTAQLYFGEICEPQPLKDHRTDL